MSDYMALRILIEQLIQKGELKEFINKSKSDRLKPLKNVWKRWPKDNKSPRPRGDKSIGKKLVIHMIYGGPKGGGSTGQTK